jgi:hypothetical protein
MRCPKCDYLLDDLDSTCPRCSAEERRGHEEAVHYVALHSAADVETARAALEATGWNTRQALSRLGVSAPPDAPPGPGAPAPPRSDPAGPPAAAPAPGARASTGKGFGTPGTPAHKAIVGIGIGVGVIVVAVVAFLCLGLFGLAGPVRKPKLQPIPPPGTPPEVSMSADQLWEECSVNQAQATTKFAGKFARITGNVRGIEVGKSTTVVVASEPSGLTGAKCYLGAGAEEAVKGLSQGQSVTVEGMISDVGATVKLRDCRIVEKGAPPAPEPSDAGAGGGFGGGDGE